ncbi:hypothetical protein Tco_1162593 [Tanacetum coccineum]
MVACLEKIEGNSDFHEIVDFLASSSIHHALTINATVDSKAVVVTETSIRSSLLFNDADGTACLTNEAIFQNLALMGYEDNDPYNAQQVAPNKQSLDRRNQVRMMAGQLKSHIKSYKVFICLELNGPVIMLQRLPRQPISRELDYKTSVTSDGPLVSAKKAAQALVVLYLDEVQEALGFANVIPNYNLRVIEGPDHRVGAQDSLVYVGHTNGTCDSKAIRIAVAMSQGFVNALPEVLETTKNSGLRILTPMYHQKQDPDSIADGILLRLPQLTQVNGSIGFHSHQLEMLRNELGDLDLFKITEKDDGIIQVSEDDEDSYEVMGGVEDKMANVGFFNSFEDDFDDQDLL